MIEMSQLASDALLESLRASGMERDKGLRLKQEGGQFILHLDSAEQDDRVIRYGDATVLIVNRDVEASIGDAFIDVEETSQGPELIIRKRVQG